MNLIDLIITIALLIAFVRGYRNGLIKEIMSLISIFFGLFLAIYFSDYIKSFLIEKFQYQSNFIDIVSFVITFLLAFFGIKILTKMIDKIADVLFLGWINNIFGGIFSTLKMVIFIGTLLIFVEKVNVNHILIKKETLAEVKLYQPIINVSKTIFPWVNSWIEKYESSEVNES